MMKPKTIELIEIVKNFYDGDQELQILKNLNFEAYKGEFIAIIGPSGSGKSTFLTIAGGLQHPTSGMVKVNEQNLQQLSKKHLDHFRFNEIGFILQTSNLVPFLTVEEQFILIDKVAKQKHKDKFLHTLFEQLKITHIMHQYPDNISGGERQRVAIAKALYQKPSVILADEPTASLDSHRSKEVAKLLSKEAKEHDTTIIMVTHDTRLIEYCDRVLYMDDGQLSPTIPKD